MEEMVTMMETEVMDEMVKDAGRYPFNEPKQDNTLIALGAGIVLGLVVKPVGKFAINKVLKPGYRKLKNAVRKDGVIDITPTENASTEEVPESEEQK